MAGPPRTRGTCDAQPIYLTRIIACAKALGILAPRSSWLSHLGLLPWRMVVYAIRAGSGSLVGDSHLYCAL